MVSTHHAHQNKRRLLLRDDEGSTLTIVFAVAVFVCLSALLFIKNVGTQSRTAATASPSPTLFAPSLVIIGGAESAFISKYGQPQQEDFSTGTLVETLKGQISIAIYPTNRSVFAIVVTSDGAGWTNDDAFAECKNFAPPDARFGSTHELDATTTKEQVWYQLGKVPCFPTTSLLPSSINSACS